MTGGRNGWSNIHCHSRYSDGENSLEELVQAALDKGFVSLGFSEHAWAPYSQDISIPREKVAAYLEEATALKKRYAGQIELYTGLEVDSHHPVSKEGLDFTIGSVHCIHEPETGEYHTIDYTHRQFDAVLQGMMGGDIERMTAHYYDLVVRFAESYRPDVIGHVDLITKLNKGGRYFDETAPWYKKLIADTAEKLADLRCIVEINTGGMVRGYRDMPYPSPEFLVCLHRQQVPVIINSDAHVAEHLDYWFTKSANLLWDTGYRTVKQLRGGEFVDISLTTLR